MITFLLIAVCVLILILIARHVKNSGFWDGVQVEVVEKPTLIGQSIEIFYKHHIGPYSRTGDYIKELQSLVADKNSKIVSIYYDNPKEVREELCQSISGVVYSVDDNVQIEPHFATNLSRWGYERVRLPAVERSVICRQKYTGFFSYIHLIWHTYPRLNKFFEEQRFNSTLTIEVVTDKNLTIYCPLDHTDDFKVPEVIPTDKLEEKLAMSDFQTTSNDSDLSDEENSSDDLEEQTEDENSQLLDA